jgi:hypothetical protein
MKTRRAQGAGSCRVGVKARRCEEAGVDSRDTWGLSYHDRSFRGGRRRQQDKRRRLRRRKTIRSTMKSRKGVAEVAEGRGYA